MQFEILCTGAGYDALQGEAKVLYLTPIQRAHTIMRALVVYMGEVDELLDCEGVYSVRATLIPHAPLASQTPEVVDWVSEGEEDGLCPCTPDLASDPPEEEEWFSSDLDDEITSGDDEYLSDEVEYLM